jgi:hypothetical protein
MGGWSTIIAKQYSGSNDCWALGADNWQEMAMWHPYYEGAGSSPFCWGIFPNPSDSWHHVVAIFDTTVATPCDRLYIDGVLRDWSVGPLGDSIRISNLPLVIGGQSDEFNEYFDGIIDEIRIYANALPLSVVQEHYYGDYSSDPIYDLRAIYHFNEGAGSSTSEATGNGNPAQFHNGPTWTTDIPEIPWS